MAVEDPRESPLTSGSGICREGSGSSSRGSGCPEVFPYRYPTTGQPVTPPHSRTRPEDRLCHETDSPDTPEPPRSKVGPIPSWDLSSHPTGLLYPTPP